MTGRRNPRSLSCRTVGRLLQRYLDGELDDERTALITEHLEACLRCGLEAGAYRWLKARLAGLAPAEDPGQMQRVRRFASQLVSEGD